MHVRGLPKPQPVFAQNQHVAVLHTLDGTSVVPLLKIDACTQCTASQHGIRCLGDEAPHPAAFVSLEVRNNDMAEARWIEHLGNCGTNVVVHGESTGMNERRFVVVDQELIEANTFLNSIGRDAVDAASQVIYARRGNGARYQRLRMLPDTLTDGACALALTVGC